MEKLVLFSFVLLAVFLVSEAAGRRRYRDYEEIPDSVPFLPLPQNRPTPAPQPAASGGQRFITAPRNCPCVTTFQFDPICGDDGNTYGNEALLRCYRRCGASRAQIEYKGACRG